MLPRMTPRQLLSLVASAAFVVGMALASPDAHAITGGQPDGAGHPEVALILNSHGLPQCSGVYVQATATQNVVLTDAHCLYAPGHLTGTRQVSFDPSWTSASPRLTGTYYIDPSYDPNTFANDIAVIDLDQDPAVVPGTLAPLDSAPVGAIIDVVGYGQPHLGQRRVGTETSTSRSASWLYLTARNANSCSGDSGGPDFLRGTDEVVALTDLGSCTTDQDTRVDTAAAEAFITAAASWDGDQPPLTASLSPISAVPGGQVTINGATNAVFVGESVRAQVLMGSTWSTVGSVKVAPGGLFSMAVTAAAPGTFRHRVVLPGTRTHPAGLSAATDVSVQPVTAVAPLRNGDWEAGTLDPWLGVGSVSRSTAHQSGSASVQVGRFRAAKVDAVLVQTFLSPVAGVLTASYQSHCGDSVAYDWTSVVLVDDTARTSVTVLPRTCAQDSTWRSTSPVPTVAGDTYTLIVTTHDDGWAADPTYALFDDVILTPAP